MVALGLFFIALTLFGIFKWWKGTLFQTKWLLWVFVFAVFLPQLANQFGWFAAEMGRQPWVVYGLLRTSEAFSQTVTANQIIFSLVMFTLIYIILFLLFIYLLDRKIKAGPYDPSYTDDRPVQQQIAESLITDKQH